MGLAEVLLEEAREEIVRATNQVAAARFARDVAADVRECRGLKRRTVILLVRRALDVERLPPRRSKCNDCLLYTSPSPRDRG